MKYVFFGGQESPFADIMLDGLTLAGFPPIAAVRDAKKPIDSVELTALKADFFLVAAFAKILKKDMFSIPRRGIIGVHPSLLPKYRGPSPIQSVLLNNEQETGTTIFLIDEKIDHGPILAQRSLAIAETDTYALLMERLAQLSVRLCRDALPRYLEGGTLQPVMQNEAKATHTKKILRLTPK